MEGEGVVTGVVPGRGILKTMYDIVLDVFVNAVNPSPACVAI